MKPATLNDLLAVGAGDIDKALDRARQEDREVKAVSASLGGAASELVAGELAKALDKEIYEVLGLAWTKFTKIKEAAEKSRKKPDELQCLELFEHDFTHTLKPTVTFLVADTPVSEIVFTLELVAKFKSIVIGIRNAAIESIGAVNAAVVVRLKYKDLKLKEAPSRDLQFPGLLRLRQPLPVS